ncbi:hypothetical protein BSIN_1506 [Burkholderia singularis]|uniref:Uncharacterized protein n=1 Tax=Burkholderia singularis TaxID=1503053 RepID=A0A238GYY0_9BURK|nr:hypothetical protein BSIN_1506 [Burkholderia singularis]
MSVGGGRAAASETKKKGRVCAALRAFLLRVGAQRCVFVMDRRGSIT